MRRAVALWLCAFLPLSGCIGNAEGDDPFAYLAKPLYASTFTLDTITEAGDFQEFRVEDGSILNMRLHIWVNATDGNAQVTITNPSGRTAYETGTTVSEVLPVKLGVWRVDVRAPGGATGDIGVLVVRA